MVDLEDILFVEFEKVFLAEGPDSVRLDFESAGERICVAAQQLFENEKTWGKPLCHPLNLGGAEKRAENRKRAKKRLAES